MDTDKRPICIALDSSPLSEQALKWALQRVVVSPDQPVHLLTVTKPIAALPSVTGDPAVAWLHPPKEELEAAEKLLSKYSKEATEAGLKNIKASALVADVGGADGVGATVCQYCVKNDCDTVVVGNRGLGTISRPVLNALGLGSVSDYLARSCNCNVTVFKGAIRKAP